MICKKCKNTKIKSRVNYFYGTKSKARIMMVCKKCGSTEVEDNSNKFGRGRGRGRR